MDWITGIQNALNYIETHIDEELSFTDIAAQAACSGYYFQRVFGILCGIPLVNISETEGLHLPAMSFPDRIVK